MCTKHHRIVILESTNMKEDNFCLFSRGSFEDESNIRRFSSHYYFRTFCWKLPTVKNFRATQDGGDGVAGGANMKVIPWWKLAKVFLPIMPRKSFLVLWFFSEPPEPPESHPTTLNFSKVCWESDKSGTSDLYFSQKQLIGVKRTQTFLDPLVKIWQRKSNQIIHFGAKEEETKAPGDKSSQLERIKRGMKRTLSGLRTEKAFRKSERERKPKCLTNLVSGDFQTFYGYFSQDRLENSFIVYCFSFVHLSCFDVMK